MSDRIVSATAEGGQIRAYVAITTQMVEKARQTHSTSPAATIAFGRLLTAGALMGSMMKGADEVLTIKIQTDGPMDGILVTANHAVDVKGIIHHPDAVSTNPLKTAEIIGNGQIQIIKDIGLKEPYVGTSPIISGEIAEDLTYYYAVSEQIPTSVALGVTLNEDGSVKNAGGFIIQLLPDTDEETITKLEKTLAATPSITNLIECGHGASSLLHHLLKEFDVNVQRKIPIAYKCDCSYEKVSKALLAIGKKDLKSLIDENKPVEMVCDFCNTHYNFTTEDIVNLLMESLGMGDKNDS